MAALPLRVVASVRCTITADDTQNLCNTRPREPTPPPVGFTTYTRNMAATQLSEHAVSGFAEAALYDRHRPSYSSEAVEKLIDAAGIVGIESASLIDLAAGTGKLTEVLAARDERFNVLAVEPHAEMRQQLIQKKLDNVKVLDGMSTAIPTDDESVEAVFSAQVCTARCD
jgi:hypothetical protein